MKNNKVIYLTAVWITVILIGIIAMSKFVETMWQTTGDKENQLTVNENNLQEEKPVFDYPYINYSQLNGDEKELYEGWFGAIEDSILPENKEFTYQMAANKLGEALKYLTGYTEHQKNPIVIELSDVNMFTLARGLNTDCYTCRQITDELIIGAVIDTTGQFWYLGVENDEIRQSGYYHKEPPPDNISEQLLKTSLQYLQELGETDTVTGYYIETASSEKDEDVNSAYIIFLKTEEGNNLSFTLNKEYSLIYYSKYPQEIQKNYIPIK